MKSLRELKTELLSDGIIDAKEVEEIREILYADGVIDSEEAEFLFEINDVVSGNENDPSWGLLFIDALTSYLLEDEISPNEIDPNEANWLFEKINGDGQIDEIERKLLLNLKSKVVSFPTNLDSLLK